jgi:hypothetical protein
MGQGADVGPVVDRRRLLIGGAAAGGLAWTAPAVLSTAAHAQGSTPPTTETPPTTAPPPPGFAPVALGGHGYGWGGGWVVADAGGQILNLSDTGWSGFGSLPIVPVGVSRSLLSGTTVVAADGAVWDPNGYPIPWTEVGRIGIAPVAVTPVSFYSELLAIDADGASRLGGGQVWNDIGLGPLGFSPRAVAGMGAPSTQRYLAVGGGGEVRVAAPSPWYDPLDGGVLDIEPVGVAIGGFGSFQIEDWLVVGAGGEVRRGSLDGASWTDPLGGGTIGIAPIGITGAERPHMVVDAAGNVRLSDDKGASWSTPAQSPIA